MPEARFFESRKSDDELTTNELVDYLGIGRATLYRWRNDDEFNFPEPRMLGRRMLLWKKDDVDTWLEENGFTAKQ